MMSLRAGATRLSRPAGRIRALSFTDFDGGGISTISSRSPPYYGLPRGPDTRQRFSDGWASERIVGLLASVEASDGGDGLDIESGVTEAVDAVAECCDVVGDIAAGRRCGLAHGLFWVGG